MSSLNWTSFQYASSYAYFNWAGLLSVAHLALQETPEMIFSLIDAFGNQNHYFGSMVGLVWSIAAPVLSWHGYYSFLRKRTDAHVADHSPKKCL